MNDVVLFKKKAMTDPRLIWTKNDFIVDIWDKTVLETLPPINISGGQQLVVKIRGR